MPNLNEIAKFRQELKNIAHEDEILASWGDRLYDELPPPDPAEVPDIDLDALLPTVEHDTQTDTPPASILAIILRKILLLPHKRYLILHTQMIRLLKTLVLPTLLTKRECPN